MTDPGATRLRVLAEASHAFAVVATDTPKLLDTIARTVATLVGDGCLVTLLAADGETLTSAATAHRDPALEADYRAYLRGLGTTRTTNTTNTSVTAEVMRTGLPKLVPEILPDTVAANADPDLRPMVARLDVHSFAVVPVRARGATIGTLSILRSRPGLGYTEDDVVLLQDLADRAGLAIENARLYDELESRVRQRTVDLEAANKELETFSYSVAHDLRAPLLGIDGFAEILADEYGEVLDEEGRRMLGIVRDSTKLMRQLIDDLLDLSRVTRIELRRERVDLSVLARGALEKLATASPARTVEASVANGLEVDADAHLVSLVLTNLISNAWKFTSKVTEARIEVGITNARPPAFFIRDNGAGFDPAYAHRLFVVFQRLHSTHEFEGSGVGLATVQRIVRRHGGRVWADGKVGEGATFYFTLEPDRE